MIEAEVLYRPGPVVPLVDATSHAGSDLRTRVEVAHKALAWLCRPHNARKKAPVVADAALKMGLHMFKLGAFTTKALNKTGPNKDRTDWWLLMVAAMKHCGILGTVVSCDAVIECTMPVPGMQVILGECAFML